MSDAVKPNQVLRLKLDDQSYKGMVVSVSEEAVLVATTAQEAPYVPVGTTIQGEMHKPDGLFHFTSRLVGYQMAPVLVLIIDRPKAIRRIQRRREPRHAVALTARLIFISAERSINAEVEVRNLSFGGMELISTAAPPSGYHCVVLLRKDPSELSTICQVMHIDKLPEGKFRLGLSFVEMSRRDLDILHGFVSYLDQHSD